MPDESLIEQLKNLVLNVQEVRQSLNNNRMPDKLNEISQLVNSIESILPEKYSANSRAIVYLASRMQDYLQTENLESLYQNVHARIHFDAIEYNATFIIQGLEFDRKY